MKFFCLLRTSASRNFINFQLFGRAYCDSASTSRLKNDIIDAATDFVPEYGWTHESIAAGAETIGLSTSAHGLFADPAKSLVLGFNRKCNRHLEQILKEETGKNNLQSTNEDTVRHGLQLRLEMLEPIIPEWSQALAILSHPKCLPEGSRLALNMADTIWYYAGDRSTNIEWYRKRLSLLAIYKSTELFMVQDMSPGFEETRQFLDRRLDDAQFVHSALQNVESAASSIGTVGKAAVATALNIMKIDSHMLYN